MFDDEDFGKKPAQPKNLEPMSLEELKTYIEDLKEEILRAEDEIIRKKQHLEAASSVFK